MSSAKQIKVSNSEITIATLNARIAQLELEIISSKAQVQEKDSVIARLNNTIKQLKGNAFPDNASANTSGKPVGTKCSGNPETCVYAKKGFCNKKCCSSALSISSDTCPEVSLGSSTKAPKCSGNPETCFYAKRGRCNKNCSSSALSISSSNTPS